MCKKNKTQVKQTYVVFSYIQQVTTLFNRASIHMTISYINMCKLNKNRERGKELEREIGKERLVVMVCVVVHLVNHLNKKPFRPLYIFKCCLFYLSVTGVFSAIGIATLYLGIV